MPSINVWPRWLIVAITGSFSSISSVALAAATPISIADVGSAKGKDAWLSHHHDLALAADGRNGETVAHRLGVGHQVGLDLEVLLRAAVGDAKAGLDLVHDHDDAVLGEHWSGWSCRN